MLMMEMCDMNGRGAVVKMRMMIENHCHMTEVKEVVFREMTRLVYKKISAWKRLIYEIYSVSTLLKWQFIFYM